MTHQNGRMLGNCSRRFLLATPLLLWICSGCSGSTSLPTCTGSPIFSVAPVAVETLSHIVPLGHLNPSGHTFPTDHLYVLATEETTVFAPGDVTITSITEQNNLTAGTTDYQIAFAPCSGVTAYYYHIDALAAALSATAGGFTDCTSYSTGGTSFRNCTASPDLAVSAGEPVGTVDGTFDFGMHDTRMTPLTFANASRWTGSSEPDNLHVACPLDYYPSDLRTTLETYLGGSTGGAAEPSRTVAPLCGEIDQDIAGTAQGVWFAAGTVSTTPEDPHLALVHDNIDPAIPVISNGTSMGTLASGAYQFTISPTGQINRDFGDITADGSIYCFENFGPSNTILLLQLTSETTLRVEGESAPDCGSGPWTFGSAFTEYER
ncbi:MAG: hypothetical protein HYV02_06555 [Deltaproteobacteria bacterium]|nr:hypothetical protein [Deltaproteobacteria bacterium]